MQENGHKRAYLSKHRLEYLAKISQEEDTPYV